MGVYPLYHNIFDIGWSGRWLEIRLRDLEPLDLETCRHQIPEVWCLMSPSLLVPFISSTSAMQRHCCSFYNRLVMKSKKPPETVSFPAALPVSFHGIGTVCRKADILPEVINEDYPSLCKTDIGPYSRGHRPCGNIPYGVILPCDQVQDRGVCPFALRV